MSLSFDNGGEPPPPPAQPPAREPAAPHARGELLYEAMVGVVAETEEAPLFGLVEALRSGIARTGRPATPWSKLSPAVQAMLVSLDERLFDDGDAGEE